MDLLAALVNLIEKWFVFVLHRFIHNSLSILLEDGLRTFNCLEREVGLFFWHHVYKGIPLQLRHFPHLFSHHLHFVHDSILMSLFVILLFVIGLNL